MELLQKVMATVLEGLLPIMCLGCKKSGDYVCKECMTSARAKPYLHYINLSTSGWLTVLSLTQLDDTFTHSLIQFYKYQCVKQAHATITEYVQKMYSTLPWHTKKNFFHKPILIPIPLHSRRFKWRGYNQAETIAQALSVKSFGKVYPVLERQIYTERQVGKDKEVRARNLKNAFSVSDTRFPITLKNTLVLVDDVATTGSTLREAALTLARRFPYSKIVAVTMAYQPLTKIQKIPMNHHRNTLGIEQTRQTCYTGEK